MPIDNNGGYVVRWVPCWTIPAFVPMDDYGCYAVQWGVFHVVTALQLYFWKPVVGEERAYLGRMITCGFQTRYGFCFFQLHGGYEKADPVPGSFHASILSPRRLTSFANVGLSRAQLVPSCEYGKRQYILQKQDFQKHNSYRIVLSYRYVTLPHGHYDETTG